MVVPRRCLRAALRAKVDAVPVVTAVRADALLRAARAKRELMQHARAVKQRVVLDARFVRQQCHRAAAVVDAVVKHVLSGNAVAR